MPRTTVQRSTWMAEELAGLVRIAHAALDDATAALLYEPGEATGRARAAARAVGELRDTLEADTSEDDVGDDASAVALPGPQLRPVVLGAHIGTELEGIAEVCVQLVELAWRRRDRASFPAGLTSPLREMAAAAVGLLATAAECLEPSSGRSAALDLGVLARGQRGLHERILTAQQPLDAADVADAVVLGCRLTRAAHHAESVITQAALLVGPAHEG